jgi:hypothetical protein
MERERRHAHDDEERRAAEPAPAPPVPAGILALQRSAGNAAVSQLLRAPKAPAQITGAKVTHDRVSVPPAAGLDLKIGPVPANAGGTLSYLVEGDGATIDGATTVDATGKVTVGARQAGGKAKATVKQEITDDTGTDELEQWAQLNFIDEPGAITATSEAAAGTADKYVGEFTHTFKPGPGGAAGLERARVNERFGGALIKDPMKEKHSIESPWGTFKLDANKPADPDAGWDLDSSGGMTSHDEVSIEKSVVDARPFVPNASQPGAKPLPQGFELTQNFHSLRFPGQTYSTAPVAMTPHVRRLQEKSGKLEVVVGAGGKEVAEDYAGPTVYRKAKASKASVEASTPDSQQTVDVTVEAIGADTSVTYSIVGADLGCTVDASSGTLTIGTAPGVVKVRAGDAAGKNFDEVSVTITKPKAAGGAKPAFAPGGLEGSPAWPDPDSE